MKTDKTFTVVFKKGKLTDDLDFNESLAYCEAFIHKINGSDDLVCNVYRGGIVTIMCNETGEDYYITPVL